MHEKRAVILGLGLTAVSIAAACVDANAVWLVIGGSTLTVLGIPLTFLRLMQRGAAGYDDPSPPALVPVKDSRALRFNDYYLQDSLERLAQNMSVYTGVGYVIVGATLAGILAPIAQMLGLLS